MTVIRGLSPLVRLRNFSFGRMKVRVVGGYSVDIMPLSRSDILVIDYGDHVGSSSTSQYGGASISGGGLELPLALAFEVIVLLQSHHPQYTWYTGTETCVVDAAGGVSRGFEPIPLFSKLHSCGVIIQSVGWPAVVSPGGVLYDPLPDVLANLEHFGRRLEVWLETELSGGSREWLRLFRSAPAAQVSIGPLQDAGFVDEDGYIVRMPEAGAALPVYGRNALGPYSKIDQFNPAAQFN